MFLAPFPEFVVHRSVEYRARTSNTLTNLGRTEDEQDRDDADGGETVDLPRNGGVAYRIPAVESNHRSTEDDTDDGQRGIEVPDVALVDDAARTAARPPVVTDVEANDQYHRRYEEVPDSRLSAPNGFADPTIEAGRNIWGQQVGTSLELVAEDRIVCESLPLVERLKRSLRQRWKPRLAPIGSVTCPL